MTPPPSILQDPRHLPQGAGGAAHKNDLCSRMDRKQRSFCYTIEFLNREEAYSTLII